MPLLPLLLGVAPTVASWILGDKTGAAVEKVTGIAREILGTDDPSGIEAAIARDPNAALQFKTALIQAEADSRRQEHEAILAQLRDVQSAREQTVRLAEPVRTIHSTASTNSRLSRPEEPRVRSSPMMCGDILAH